MDCIRFIREHADTGWHQPQPSTDTLGGKSRLMSHVSYSMLRAYCLLARLLLLVAKLGESLRDLHNGQLFPSQPHSHVLPVSAVATHRHRHRHVERCAADKINYPLLPRHYYSTTTVVLIGVQTIQGCCSRVSEYLSGVPKTENGTRCSDTTGILLLLLY